MKTEITVPYAKVISDLTDIVSLGTFVSVDHAEKIAFEIVGYFDNLINTEYKYVEIQKPGLAR